MTPRMVACAVRTDAALVCWVARASETALNAARNASPGRSAG